MHRHAHAAPARVQRHRAQQQVGDTTGSCAARWLRVLLRATAEAHYGRRDIQAVAFFAHGIHRGGVTLGLARGIARFGNSNLTRWFVETAEQRHPQPQHAALRVFAQQNKRIAYASGGAEAKEPWAARGVVQQSPIESLNVGIAELNSIDVAGTQYTGTSAASREGHRA